MHDYLHADQEQVEVGYLETYNKVHVTAILF